MSNGGLQREVQMHFRPRQQDRREPPWPLAQGEGLTQLVHAQQPPHPASWGARVHTPRGPQGRRPSAGEMQTLADSSLLIHACLFQQLVYFGPLPACPRVEGGPGEDPGPVLCSRRRSSPNDCTNTGIPSRGGWGSPPCPRPSTPAFLGLGPRSGFRGCFRPPSPPGRRFPDRSGVFTHQNALHERTFSTR